MADLVQRTRVTEAEKKYMERVSKFSKKSVSQITRELWKQAYPDFPIDEHRPGPEPKKEDPS